MDILLQLGVPAGLIVLAIEVARERLRTIPLAVAEAVKPLQNIGDVKMIDMGGGLPRGVNGGEGNGHGNGSRMDTLVDSLLAYRANAPVIDQLLTEAGFTNNGGLVSTLLGKKSEVPATPAVHTSPDGHGAPAE